jgi:type VI protein secretion system component VasK
MAVIRETRVTPDVEGDVVERNTVERPVVIERPVVKKKGGFGWGMILGVLIVAGAIVAYAYNQGSFQTAGARADQATQTAQVEASQTANNARQAVNNATEDNSQQPAQPQTSDTPPPTQSN